jgi:hypothetical protein
MKIVDFFLTFAILVSLLGCLSGNSESVPNELIGVWKTDSPQYKQCSIELTRDYILFINSRSAAHIDTNFVLGMKRVPERGHFLCTILYENIHEQRYKLYFYYYPKKGGVIRLKNQIDVEWRKVRSISGQESSPISG